MLRSLYIITGILLLLFAFAAVLTLIVVYFHLITDDLSRVPFYVIFLGAWQLITMIATIPLQIILSYPMQIISGNLNTLTAVFVSLDNLLGIAFLFFLGGFFLSHGRSNQFSRSLTIAACLSLFTVLIKIFLAINLFLFPCREFCGVGVYIVNNLGLVPITIALFIILIGMFRSNYQTKSEKA